MPSTGHEFDKATQIALLAQALVGVRFRHQGRSVRGGLDCVGLAAVVCDRLAISYRDRRDYPHPPPAGWLETGIVAAGFHACPDQEPAPGRLALFAVDGRVQHSAILIDDGMVHACGRARRVIQHALTPDWRRRLVQVFDFPG